MPQSALRAIHARVQPLGAFLEQRGVTRRTAPYIAFALLIVVIAVARSIALAGRMPYSEHPDEQFLTRPAFLMLRTGDLNPHFFRYPSLPIYLAALVSKIGKAFTTVPLADWRIPTLAAPYYPRAPFTAIRFVFSFFSVLTFAAVGLVAARVYRSQALLIAAPLVLASSHVYQHTGLDYLNVDVLAAAFTMGALATVFLSWERQSIVLKAVLPGVLLGLATACKYNAGLVAVPCILCILFAAPRRRLLMLFVFAATAAITFFVCVPYSILDFTKFRADVEWEIHHYRTGHAGFDGEPGLPQLGFYVAALVRDYSAATMVLAVPAALAVPFVGRADQRADWRRILALLSLPLLTLAHMTTNRVHFLRTVVIVFVSSAILQAGAVVVVARALTALSGRLLPRGKTRGWLEPLLVTAGFALVAAALNPATLFDRNWDADQRNVSTDWIAARAKGATVFVPADVAFATDRPDAVHIQATAPGLGNLETLVAQNGSGPLYAIAPRYAGNRGREARLSRELNAHVLETMRKLGGKPVLTLTGASSSPKFAEPVNNPELTVFALPARK